MFGSDYVPYEIIGFAVFWLVTALILVGTLLVLYSLWIRAIESVRDNIWEGKNPSKGEKPDGWKLVAAFIVHIVWCVSKFRQPICWRWKTYKEEKL